MRRNALLLNMTMIVRLLTQLLQYLKNRNNDQRFITMRQIEQALDRTGLGKQLYKICIESGYSYRTCGNYGYFLKKILDTLAEYCHGIAIIRRFLEELGKIPTSKIEDIIKELEEDYAWYSWQVDYIRKLLYRNKHDQA